MMKDLHDDSIPYISTYSQVSEDNLTRKESEETETTSSSDSENSEESSSGNSIIENNSLKEGLSKFATKSTWFSGRKNILTIKSLRPVS